MTTPSGQGSAAREIERPLYLCAAMTGLRQGELIALRWYDVDWAASRVRVADSYVRGEFDSVDRIELGQRVVDAERVAMATRLRDAADAIDAGRPAVDRVLREVLDWESDLQRAHELLVDRTMAPDAASHLL